MTTFMKVLSTVTYHQKFIGLFLIILGIPILIVDKTPRASFVLMIGLYTLFTSKEKVPDERSSSLKMTGMYISIILAYTFKLVTSYMFLYHWIPFDMTDINHFIILVFSIANVLYYYRLYFTD